MTEHEIHLTGAAEADLIGASDYIENVLYDPKAAEDLLDEAEKVIGALGSFPEKYPPAEDPVLRAWGIRWALVKNYLAFYTVSDEEKRIYVVRFLHYRQNWAAILRRAEGR